MAHPYESQVKSSNSRRLKALGAHAGKVFGASSMFHAKSYPKKNAGTERPMTLEGGSAKKRADRKSNKYAAGGRVFGSEGIAPRPAAGGLGRAGGMGRTGGGKKKGKGHSTTNIIIAGGGPGGGGARPVPVPVPRPVPVPVAAGAPVPRPPLPGAGGPPVNVNVPPPAMAGPAPMPVMGPRPPGMPGMQAGGVLREAGPQRNWGVGYKSGGTVKKKASGGFLKDESPKGYRGFPHSPTTETDDAVSGHKRGGVVKKRQMGGGLGAPPPGAPGAIGAPVRRPGAGPATVPLTGGAGPNPRLAGRSSLAGGRFGGGRFGMKKGGKAASGGLIAKRANGGQVGNQDDGGGEESGGGGSDFEGQFQGNQGGGGREGNGGGGGGVDFEGPFRGNRGRGGGEENGGGGADFEGSFQDTGQNNPFSSLMNAGPFGISGGKNGRFGRQKRGGRVKHADEAEDKKLIARMLKKEEKTEKKKHGGSIKKYQDGGVTPEDIEQDRKQDEADTAKEKTSGIMGALKGLGSAINPRTGTTGGVSGASQAAQSAANVAAGTAGASQRFAGGAGGGGGGMKFAPPPGSAPSKSQFAKNGGFVPKNETSKDPALKASMYRNQGDGYHRGGSVKKASAASGLGRLGKIAGARAVPAKTEI